MLLSPCVADTRPCELSAREQGRQHEARTRSCAGAGPGGGAAQIQTLDRRVVARIARHRPEEEILVQVVAAREIVAADQAGVELLQVLRRHHMAGQYLGAQSW